MPQITQIPKIELPFLQDGHVALPWYRAFQQIIAFINAGSSGRDGSVVSVDTGAGLTGGPITTEGTISFANIEGSQVLANLSGTTAPPEGVTLARLTGVGSALAWTNPQTITLTGDTTGVSAPIDGSSPISFATVGVQAAKWTAPITLSFTGDTIGAGSVDGSANVSIALTGVQAAKWTTARTLAFTGDTTGSGSIDGSGNVSIAMTGVQAAKWTTPRTLSFTGDTTGSGTLDGSGNVAIAMTGAQAAKWTTARTLSFTGDVTGSGSVDGSANVATALTLLNVVTAGTNTKLTYNAKGLVIGGAQAAASDLSNGTTGTGAIVLASGANTTLPVYTVATLPTPTVGAQAMASDSNASTFWTIVAGGGTTPIRVTADGTNWRIG